MDTVSLPDHIQRSIAELDTPFFLFDLDNIKHKIDCLVDSLNPDQVFYALKSNSLPPVLKTIATLGCGFEVNNVAEYEKAVNAGAHPEKIINSSPIAAATDVRAMWDNGVSCFTFDSKDQVHNLKLNAPGAKTVMRIASTNQGSRFDLSRNLGVEPNAAADLLHYAKENSLKIFGLTFHVGSQCLSPSNWREGIVLCADLFNKFPELEMINLGGGFPVCYNGPVPDIQTIAEAINQSINDHFEDRPIIYVEPGRFIVGDCALACGSITNLDHADDLSRATVDLSVFGGFMEIIEIGDGFQYPIISYGNGDQRHYRIIGATCAGTDVIAEKIQLPRLEVDHRNPDKSSRIYLLNTGAYTLEYIMTSSPSGFNGLFVPRVYYMENGNIRLAK